MLKSYQIIGYSAGVPTQYRGVTCVMITTSNYDLMIDCGEGSYLRWQKAGYKWKNLKYLLITHMHPDHTGGLMPLLFYRKLFGIKTALTLIGPPQLETFIADNFRHTGINNKQNIDLIDISKNQNINLQDKIEIKSEKMKHKIPCWGYKVSDGEKNIVFITDTLPNPNAIKLSNNAEVLIHEATFDYKAKKKAFEHFHTTEIQAMEIADQSNVQKLILTHFSPKLSDEKIQKWTWNDKPCVVFDKRQVI